MQPVRCRSFLGLTTLLVWTFLWTTPSRGTSHRTVRSGTISAAQLFQTVHSAAVATGSSLPTTAQDACSYVTGHLGRLGQGANGRIHIDDTLAELIARAGDLSAPQTLIQRSLALLSFRAWTAERRPISTKRLLRALALTNTDYAPRVFYSPLYGFHFLPLSSITKCGPHAARDVESFSLDLWLDPGGGLASADEQPVWEPHTVYGVHTHNSPFRSLVGLAPVEHVVLTTSPHAADASPSPQRSVAELRKHDAARSLATTVTFGEPWQESLYVAERTVIPAGAIYGLEPGRYHRVNALKPTGEGAHPPPINLTLFHDLRSAQRPTVMVVPDDLPRHGLYVMGYYYTGADRSAELTRAIAAAIEGLADPP
jgi:hypothetical protein